VFCIKAWWKICMYILQSVTSIIFQGSMYPSWFLNCMFFFSPGEDCNFIIQKLISFKRSWYHDKKLARTNIPHSFDIKSQDHSIVCSPFVRLIAIYILWIVPQLIFFCPGTHPLFGWTCRCLSLPALARYGSTGSPTEVACHPLLIQPIQLEQPTTVLSTMHSTRNLSQRHGSKSLSWKHKLLILQEDCRDSKKK